MTDEFPYKECETCNYRGFKESIETYGLRTGGINFVDTEMACGEGNWRLEEIRNRGAKAPSSGILLNGKRDTLK